MHLADVNFWLALTFEAHSHHIRARNWFEQVPVDSCGFCRLAQNGFLRLATNPAVFGDEAVTMAEAWGLYDAILDDDRVIYWDEPPGLESIWKEFTSRRSYSTNLWSDACLAAFAMASGIGIVSFDNGFRQFSGLNLTTPA